MKGSNTSSISAFKSEKSLQILIAVYLSIILLSIILILIKIEMTVELQQVLVVVLGLFSIATLDAFKKALDSKPLSFENIANQIIIREGGVYVGGDYIGGDINHAAENRQTLAEAAIEIQKLLQELERLNPSATEEEKVAYINKEVNPNFKHRVASAAKEPDEATIEKQVPSLKSRIIEAIRSEGISAMEGYIGSSFSSMVYTVVKDWQSLEENQKSSNKSDSNNG